MIVIAFAESILRLLSVVEITNYGIDFQVVFLNVSLC